MYAIGEYFSCGNFSNNGFPCNHFPYDRTTMASFARFVASLNFLIMASLGLYTIYNMSKKKKPNENLSSICDCVDNTDAAVDETTLGNQVNTDRVLCTACKFPTESHSLYCLSGDNEMPVLWSRAQQITIYHEGQNYSDGFGLFFNLYWIPHQYATDRTVLTRVAFANDYVRDLYDNVKMVRCGHNLVWRNHFHKR